MVHAWTRTHTRLTALFPGLPGWAGTRKVKPVWILPKQETVSGSGISWDICKSASHSRQITTPAPHRSFFTGRMPFLPPSQQCQSTEGKKKHWRHAWTFGGKLFRNKQNSVSTKHTFSRDGDVRCCRIVATLLYFGLSLSVGQLAGSFYVNIFISGFVELPGSVTASYAANK